MLPASVGNLVHLTVFNLGQAEGPAGLAPVCCPAAVGAGWVNAGGGTRPPANGVSRWAEFSRLAPFCRACQEDKACSRVAGVNCPDGFYVSDYLVVASPVMLRISPADRRRSRYVHQMSYGRVSDMLDSISQYMALAVSLTPNMAV